MRLPLFIISDLHLGAGSTDTSSKQGKARDKFSAWGHGKDLLKFLDTVAAADGSLLILGDLFEFWKNPIGHVLTQRRPLLDALQRFGRDDTSRLRYVIGNHDADLQAFIGADEWLTYPFFQYLSGSFTATFDDRPHVILHGHEYDSFNAEAFPGSGRALTILAALGEDWVGAPYFDVEKRWGVEESLSAVGERVLLFWDWLKGGWLKRLVKKYSPAATPAVRDSQEFDAYAEGVSPDLLRLEEQLFTLLTTNAPASPSAPSDSGIRGYFPTSRSESRDLLNAYLNQAWQDYSTCFRVAPVSVHPEGVHLRGLQETVTASGASVSPKPASQLAIHLEQMRRLQTQSGQGARVIAGHTHLAGRCGDWYYNSGSWIGQYGEVMCITTGNAPALYEWQGSELVKKPWLEIQ